jgi:hypothetical protein
MFPIVLPMLLAGIVCPEQSTTVVDVLTSAGQSNPSKQMAWTGDNDVAWP